MIRYDTTPSKPYDPRDTSCLSQWNEEVVDRDDPYAGLNRKQRRAAIASERRAFKKQNRK